MIIAALFTIPKTWKQSKCPSTEEWIEKMWYVYTVEYYSAIELNDIILFTATWMKLEIIILSKSDRERQISFDITYMLNLKKKVERDKLGVWDENIHTTVYKIDRQQGPTV